MKGPDNLDAVGPFLFSASTSVREELPIRIGFRRSQGSPGTPRTLPIR